MHRSILHAATETFLSSSFAIFRRPLKGWPAATHEAAAIELNQAISDIGVIRVMDRTELARRLLKGTRVDTGMNAAATKVAVLRIKLIRIQCALNDSRIH
jgi:hypothetical protein